MVRGGGSVRLKTRSKSHQEGRSQHHQCHNIMWPLNELALFLGDLDAPDFCNQLGAFSSEHGPEEYLNLSPGLAGGAKQHRGETDGTHGISC